MANIRDFLDDDEDWLGPEDDVWDAQARLQGITRREAKVEHFRRIRARSTDSVVVEDVDGGRWRVATPTTQIVRRGRTEMDTAEDEFRAALLKFAGVKSLHSRWSGGQPPKGSVLRWIHTFENRNAGTMKLDRTDSDSFTFEVNAPTEYVFVAIRANDGNWYVSGTRENRTYEWDTLVKKIGDSPCQVVSKWEEVPVPEKPTEESLDPETWARQMFGSKPVTGDQGTTNT